MVLILSLNMFIRVSGKDLVVTKFGAAKWAEILVELGQEIVRRTIGPPTQNHTGALRRVFRRRLVPPSG